MEAQGNVIVETVHKLSRENAKLKKKLWYWRAVFAIMTGLDLLWAWKLIR